MCDAKILSQKGSAMISRCADCKGIFIWNNNLVMNFTEENFRRFKDFTAKMDANEHTLPFPDGQERMVMRTPASDINFTFTPDEWDDFCDAMEEATHMLAVYSLME